jgi:hypothetical protein
MEADHIFRRSSGGGACAPAVGEPYLTTVRVRTRRRVPQDARPAWALERTPETGATPAPRYEPAHLLPGKGTPAREVVAEPTPSPMSCAVSSLRLRRRQPTVGMATTRPKRANQPSRSSTAAKIGIAVHSPKVTRLAAPCARSEAVASGSSGCGQRGSLTWKTPATNVVAAAVRVSRRSVGVGDEMTAWAAANTTKPGTRSMRTCAHVRQARSHDGVGVNSPALGEQPRPRHRRMRLLPRAQLSGATSTHPRRARG